MKPVKKRRADVALTNPFSEHVLDAERIVLAERSPNAARFGTDDSSLGDLILALIGRTSRESLELLGMDLLSACHAVEADEGQVDLGPLLGSLARRASVAAQLHRRIARARRPRSGAT